MDGIIVLAVQEKFVPAIRRLRDNEFPIVTIGVTFPELSDLGFGTDHQAISSQATEYLIQRGYRRIGMLSGPKYSSTDVRERERGYCKTMYASGSTGSPEAYIVLQ